MNNVIKYQFVISIEHEKHTYKTTVWLTKEQFEEIVAKIINEKYPDEV